MFTVYDWSMVALHMAAMLWIGFLFSRQQTSTKAYFLGNNEMSWWAVGISIIATETSALTVIGIPAMAYTGNIKFIQIVLGYVIARVIVAFLIIPKYFAGQALYTPYELLSRKFGGAARTVAVLFFMISGLLGAGVRVYVTAIPMKLVLGLDIFPCIFIFCAVCIAYTYLGGIKTVIWTDLIQCFLFVFGGVFAVFYIAWLLPGGFTQAMTEASKAGKLDWLDLNFALGGDFNIWMALIGATALGVISHGSDQMLVQRVLACKSQKEGQKAMILSGVLILPVFAIFLLTGIMLWTFYQHNAFLMQPVDAAGQFKADYIFPVFIISQMPIFLKGIVIASILAAAMSSLDSALSALSSVYVMNVHKEYFGKGGNKDEAYYMRCSKITILLCGAVLIAIAFLCQNVPLIFNAAFKLAGITSGAVLGGLLFAIFTRNVRSQVPIITGMIISSSVMLAITILGQYDKLAIHWPWYGFIGTVTTLIPAYLISCFTDKENRK